MVPNFEELLKRAMKDNSEILEALEKYDRKEVAV